MTQVISAFILLLPIICIVTCETEVSIARSLASSGYHTDIVLDIDLYTSGASYSCSLLLVEYLPKSVYVDTELLYTLEKHNILSAFSNITLDTEVTAENVKASPFKVFIYLPEQSHPKYTSSIHLPINLRYQSATVGGGFKTINIGQPTLFSKCNNQDIDGPKFDQPCSYNDRSTCKWIKLDVTFSAASLTTKVPVGDTAYNLYITITAYFVLYGATFYIARAFYKKRV